ncbi:MAG TPA: tetratricopeptide repeat protein, partial [Gemmataceae bacterium]|nr:tetratricopeptide repeat protein [Gemmataceae bacterium]
SAGATTAAPTGSAVILGTPSYMAPEQAGGRAAAVSPATDLYALGTILYEMLTGRPPFQAATPLDTLQRVRTEEPVPPSRLQPKVPRDLETICLKCLEKEPARRYPTAEALADDLARFREGRPVQARPVGPAARLGRWCRRRPVPAALAAALALVVVLGFAAVTWQWRRADDNFRRAEANFTEAERQRQQAEENFRQAFEAVADFTDVHRHPLLEAPRMRPVKKELFEKALKYYQSFVRQRGGDSALELELANAYVWTGSIVAILGSPAEALTAYEQARALYEKITTEQPDRDDLRALLAHCYCRLGWQQHLMERPDEALHWCRRACEILEQLAPTDCFLRIKGIKGSPDAWLKDRLVLARQALGGVHQARGEVPQAIAVYEQAARLGEELVREVPEEPGYGSRLIFTYQRLSELYRADNRPDQARQADQRAASLGPGPGATALPGTGLSATAAEQYHSLAREYRAANQLPEALQSYQRAVAVWEGMVQAGQVGLARSQWEVGEVYYALGQKPAALRTLQENCRLLEELVRQRPLDEKAQRLRAQSLYWLGKLLAESNQPAEAVHSYRSAAEVYEQMINAQPQDHSLRRTLAACYHNLGRLYADTGEPGSALGHYHRAVALREQLCRDEPAGVDHVSDLGGTWMRLGLLLEGLGRHEEAVQAFREAADKHREAARRAPGEERYLQQLHTDEQHLERLKRSAAPSR